MVDINILGQADQFGIPVAQEHIRLDCCIPLVKYLHEVPPYSHPPEPSPHSQQGQLHGTAPRLAVEGCGSTWVHALEMRGEGGGWKGGG